MKTLIEKLRDIAARGMADYCHQGMPDSEKIAAAADAIEHLELEIDELRKENAALLAANLDCILHYKDAVAELENLQQQKPIAYLASRDGVPT